MKKKLSLRMMSLLLALILTVASIPSVITAEYGIKEEIISNELLNDNGNISNEVINDESLVEDISQRGKFSKNYISRDGSRYLVVFPEQVHYLDAGEWREIDNTLRYDSTTKKYITRNQSFTTGFSADSGSGDLVTITDGEYSLSWSVCFPGADIGDSSFNIQVNSTQGNLGVASSAAQIISVGVGTSSEKKLAAILSRLTKQYRVCNITGCTQIP